MSFREQKKYCGPKLANLEIFQLGFIIFLIPEDKSYR